MPVIFKLTYELMFIKIWKSWRARDMAQWKKGLHISMRTSVSILSTYVKSPVWQSTSITQGWEWEDRHGGSQSPTGQPSLPPGWISGSVRERPCFTKWGRQPQRKITEVILWPLHVHAVVNTSTNSHAKTYQKFLYRQSYFGNYMWEK